jgi:hypothetical protein
LWLSAMTVSNAVSIQLQSSWVMVSGGNSLVVWLPWPETRPPRTVHFVPV